MIYPFYAKPTQIFYHKKGKQEAIKNLTEICKNLSDGNQRKIKNLISIIKKQVVIILQRYLLERT